MQTDRQDKSAVGWETKDTVSQHESQTGLLLFTYGFCLFLSVYIVFVTDVVLVVVYF